MSATPAQTAASPTPILDREAPLPKPESVAKRTAMSLLIWFVLVIAVAITFIFWPTSLTRELGRRMNLFGRTGSPFYPLWVFLCALLAGFVAVAIHEIAHAAVGATVGFRFNSLRIGRLQFDRPFRFSLYRGRGTGAGGWASLFPVRHDKLIARTTVMLLAGPLSNLLSIAVLLVLPYSKGLFSTFFICSSALLGLMNLVPLRSRAVISDGGRILMLLQNRARGERWLAVIKLIEEMRTGPPEQMTPEFIAKATAIEDKSPDTMVAHAIAYAAAFWQHKDDEAARLLETCLRHCSLSAPSQRQGLMSDAAVFQARRRRRVDLAEQWLADLPQKVEFPWLRTRAEAAILEAKGDVKGAGKKLDEVETLVAANPNQALREISLRGVRRWKAELQI